MPKLDVLSKQKKKVGSVELSDEVFAAKVNVPLVHQVLNAERAAKRQGTAKTKTRSEVRGGGKKPFRQKGTGNARRGSSRSPLIVGGGIAFGPQPRSYLQKTPKKMVRGALRSVLSDRCGEKRIIVVDDLSFDQPKTKEFCDIFNKKFDLKNVLVVDQENRNLELSGRNVPNVKVLRAEQINVYDVLRYEWMVVTQSAAEQLDGRLKESGRSEQGATQ